MIALPTELIPLLIKLPALFNAEEAPSLIPLALFFTHSTLSPIKLPAILIARMMRTYTPIILLNTAPTILLTGSFLSLPNLIDENPSISLSGSVNADASDM